MTGKAKMGKNVSIYPMPVTLLGAMVDGKPNFMTAAWITRANSNPPLLAVSINKPRFTARGIRENKTFSVNIPGANMVELVDYCGLVSGHEADKSKLFEVFYGDLKTAPMIKSCPISMECRLHDIYQMPTNDLFIGEIMAGYIEEGAIVDGKPEVHMINPLLLTMPDNRYWMVGEYAGDAWGMGKKRKGL